MPARLKQIGRSLFDFDLLIRNFFNPPFLCNFKPLLALLLEFVLQ